MSKIKTAVPSPDSREPVLAAGAMTAGGMLVWVLASRWLELEPEVALGLASVLGPVVTAVAGRLRAYAPATVARLLAARGSKES